jgi:hypothetical protein
MSDWQPKVKYYVKSGNGYLSKFEDGGLPVMASSKSLAREFTDIEMAKAAAQKILEQGYAASIELDDEIALEENKWQPRG